MTEERLRDLDKLKIRWNPGRKLRFEALRITKPEDVRVVIIGQDPYPKSKYCTGVAFSIPEECDFYPATLCNIFDEYQADLGYPEPSTGSLLPWVKQGVLLWNVYPTCSESVSLSHHWEEYKYLTWQILDKLSDQSVVVVTLGGQAREILRPQDWDNFEVLCYSHPSPLGKAKGRAPFEGSRMFSSINGKLNDLGLEPIDWRLP